MRVYIKASAAITPQDTFPEMAFQKKPDSASVPFLKAMEPDYSQYIDPKLSRRMSRIIKMAIAVSKQALTKSGVSMPDGIIVGTGLGCMADTEKFLKEIISTDEGLLSPTAFIQSTHNTVAGQIALLLGCTGYNFTYTNRGHSFENALMDAMLQLESGSENILLGGCEETTESVLCTFQEIGCAGSPDEAAEMPVLGEGASFFLLSAKGEPGEVFISGMNTFTNVSVGEMKESLDDFLAREGVDVDSIDLLVMGYNNDQSDTWYQTISKTFPDEVPVISFKNISGEYFTSVSYGLHHAALVLQRQSLPDQPLISGTFNGNLNRVLIYNHYNGFHHTFILLSR